MDGFGLDDLAEDSEEDGGRKRDGLGDEEMGFPGRQSATQLARLSGSGRVRSNGAVEKETVKVGKGAGRGE